MQLAKSLRPVILGIILCVSHSRTFSLIHGYSAPIEIYKHLEHHDDAGAGDNSFITDCIFLVKGFGPIYTKFAAQFNMHHPDLFCLCLCTIFGGIYAVLIQQHPERLLVSCVSDLYTPSDKF